MLKRNKVIYISFLKLKKIMYTFNWKKIIKRLTLLNFYTLEYMNFHIYNNKKIKIKLNFLEKNLNKILWIISIILINFLLQLKYILLKKYIYKKINIYFFKKKN